MLAVNESGNPIRQLAPNADHRAHKDLNNRIEGSHRPTRRREKVMGRFKSQRQAQRFLAAHDQINTIFKPRRYRLSATSYPHARADAFDLWADYTLEMTPITIIATKAQQLGNAPEDYRGLSPFIYLHINPYGRFEVDLDKRIDFEKMAA